VLEWEDTPTLPIWQFIRDRPLVAVDTTIAERAADLRARWRIRTPDALQIATALDAGCQAFLTNDHALRRVTDLQILVLDDLEL
jgi:predicted nucleic acid-binding protein